MIRSGFPSYTVLKISDTKSHLSVKMAYFGDGKRIAISKERLNV